MMLYKIIFQEFIPDTDFVEDSYELLHSVSYEVSEELFKKLFEMIKNEEGN